MLNVTQEFKAELKPGAASYRFDELPKRVVQKTLPANYDLEKIAGVVRIAGGAGNDSIEINARDASGGATVTVEKQQLELADYEFDRSKLLLTGVRVLTEGVPGVDEVQQLFASRAEN